MKKISKGFTLIELLIVIAIIAILTTVVFVALNPVKRFANAREARRFQDVNGILTAVHEYAVDNNGALPSGITTSELQLGTAATGCNAAPCTTAAAACVDLSTALAPYLKSIPTDPGGVTANTTEYTIVRDANNIVTVKACNVESGGSTIQVSR